MRLPGKYALARYCRVASMQIKWTHEKHSHGAVQPIQRQSSTFKAFLGRLNIYVIGQLMLVKPIDFVVRDVRTVQSAVMGLLEKSSGIRLLSG